MGEPGGCGGQRGAVGLIVLGGRKVVFQMQCQLVAVNSKRVGHKKTDKKRGRPERSVDPSQASVVIRRGRGGGMGWLIGRLVGELVGGWWCLQLSSPGGGGV